MTQETIIIDERHAANVERFDSVAAFGRAIEPLIGGKSASGWTGRDSGAELVRKCQVGDDSAVPKAERLLEKIGADMELSARALVCSPVGFAPNVPAFMAGEPENMFALAEVEDRPDLVRIMVSTTSSSGIDASDMERRGAAVLALTMAVADVRPVELHVFTDLGGRIGGKRGLFATVVRINTAPLNLSEAAFVLSNPAFTRTALYDHAQEVLGSSGNWGFNHDYSTIESDEHLSLVRQALGLSPRDLIIPSMSAAQECRLSMKDPVAWVNLQMERFRKALDEFHA